MLTFGLIKMLKSIYALNSELIEMLDFKIAEYFLENKLFVYYVIYQLLKMNCQYFHI